MRRQFKYGILATGLLVLMTAISGCEREPAVDLPAGTDVAGSIFKSNVVQLDSLVFANPVRINGNVRFDLLGTPPQVKPGDLVFYPGHEGVFGKVLTATVIGSRMHFQLEKSAIDQIFSSLTIQDTISGEVIKSRTRTDANTWNSDTLRLTGLSLFDDFWQSSKLTVRFTAGKLFSGTGTGPFLLAGQGTDPWFDRCRLDFDYSMDIAARLEIQALGAVDAADSLLVEQTVYGPYLVDGFPITYRVDTWLGFRAVTQKDTVLTISFTGINQGRLSLSYNYWESWKLDQNRLRYIADIQDYSGSRLAGYEAEVFVSQVIIPYFCGEPAFTLSSRFSARASADVAIPNWQSSQSASIRGILTRSGNVLGEYVPDHMSNPETLLYLESQAGVIPNQPPRAAFTISPPAGFTDTNFEFNASNSSDLESPAKDLMFRWDFDGDSHYDTEFSSARIEFHRFALPGKYQPILEVLDPQGLTARRVSYVEVVLSSSAPIAYFTVIPESGRTTNVFLFDASGSYDAEDGINLLKVRWDFDDDGLFEQPWTTNKAAFYVYSEPGTYLVTLEVLDTQGLKGSTSRQVHVAAPNIKPTALFTADPESGTTETQFFFDASGSTDPEDPPEKLKVRWDWENDGEYDTEYSFVKTIVHTFDSAGSYRVVMEVIDSEGFGSNSSIEITVSNPNTPPEADFSVNPAFGLVNREITFDASLSKDAEDASEQLQVRWDWDNDGTYDTEFTALKVTKRIYPVAGTYMIRLEVMDTGGLTDTRVKSVVIQ